MLVTLLGWLAGLALGVALTFAARTLPFVNEDRFLVYAVLVSLGITVGLAQWLVLRRFLSGPGPWLAATFAGYTLCIVVIVLASRLTNAGSAWRDALVFTFMGLAVGGPQAFVFGRRFHGAAVWVLATIASFMAFFWLAANPTRSPAEFIATVSLVAAAGSGVTGLTLAWLLERPIQ